MLRKSSFSVVICLAAAGLSFGQDFPKAGPEHAELKKMEGKWDTVMKMQGQESKGTCTYKSICDGMWLASDFEGDLGGVTFRGHGLDGYDQAKKKYVGIWVDSMTTAPMTMEGDHDAKTKTTTMTGESTGPDGKSQKFKAVTEMKDIDHFTFKMLMIQPDGKDQLAFTIDYTRRK